MSHMLALVVLMGLLWSLWDLFPTWAELVISLAREILPSERLAILGLYIIDTCLILMGGLILLGRALSSWVTWTTLGIYAKVWEGRSLLATASTLSPAMRLTAFAVLLLVWHMGKWFIQFKLYRFIFSAVYWCYSVIISWFMSWIHAMWNLVKAVGFAVTFPFWIIYFLHQRYENRELMTKQTPEGSIELSEREILMQIYHKLTGGRMKEAVQEGSPIIPVTTWPAHLVSIQTVEGKHLGFGTFVLRNGEVTLMTAMHVIKLVANGGKLTANGISVAVNPLWKLMTWGSVDAVFIKVPNNLPAILGVKKMSLARTSGNGAAVTIYGFVNGQMSRTIGVITQTDKRFKYRHTATTLVGHCGSPLISGENKIVGIHIESDGMGYNYALSMDWALVTKEADSYAEESHLYSYADDNDFTEDADEEIFYDYDAKRALRETEEELQGMENDEGGTSMSVSNKRYRLLAGGQSTEEPTYTRKGKYGNDFSKYYSGFQDVRSTSKWEEDYGRDSGLPDLDPSWTRHQEAGEHTTDKWQPEEENDSGFYEAEVSTSTTLGPTSNGGLKKKNKPKSKRTKEATSVSADNTSAQPVETTGSYQDQTAASAKPSPVSQTGGGQGATQPQPSSPSSSTKPALDKGKSPLLSKKTKSSKPAAPSTQELLSRLSSLEAKLKVYESGIASASNPPTLSPVTTAS